MQNWHAASETISEETLKSGIQREIDEGERAKRGHRVFTDTVETDLRRYLNSAERNGIELGQLRSEAEALIETLPSVEKDNCIKMAEKCARNGDDVGSALWHERAIQAARRMKLP